MAEEIKKPKKRGRKIEAERGAEPQIVAEDKAVKEEKKYEIVHLVAAIEDLALEIDNAFFKHPFKRCPDCAKKGNNTVLAYFGVNGNNKIGNLKGFDATNGDLISWYSETYKGISFVKSKDNGVFELETSPFNIPRKEPAVVERMVIPSKYRPILGEMANYLAKPLSAGCETMVLAKIGGGYYPDVIAKKL